MSAGNRAGDSPLLGEPLARDGRGPRALREASLVFVFFFSGSANPQAPGSVTRSCTSLKRVAVHRRWQSRRGSARSQHVLGARWGACAWLRSTPLARPPEDASRSRPFSPAADCQRRWLAFGVEPLALQTPVGIRRAGLGLGHKHWPSSDGRSFTSRCAAHSPLFFRGR